MKPITQKLSEWSKWANRIEQDIRDSAQYVEGRYHIHWISDLRELGLSIEDYSKQLSKEVGELEESFTTPVRAPSTEQAREFGERHKCSPLCKWGTDNPHLKIRVVPVSLSSIY